MRVLVTGADGFLGGHVVQTLEARGHTVCEQSFGGRAYYDLWFRGQARRLLHAARPEAVIHLAKPATEGIASMQATPFSISAEAAQIDLQVIEAAATAEVQKLVCLGSVCAYPEGVRLPAREQDLLAGAPEPINGAWGQVKRLQLSLLQAARVEYGLRGIHLVMANCYGPGDRSAHVIPSLIGRIRAARRAGDPSQRVVVWGNPLATRSFLYVADAAEGIVRALETYDSPEPLNLCQAGETTMERLAETVAMLLGYPGGFYFDRGRPVGQPRRAFSTARLQSALDWVPDTDLITGLTATLAWHRQEYP